MIGSTSKIRKQKASRGRTAGSLSKSKQITDYGLGLDVVVVVLVEVDEFGVVAVVVVFVLVVSLVSFVFSVGFTTVVLFSTFFSGAGEVAVVGATTVLSSHAARSAALAKTQSNFFISFWIDCPSWTMAESNRVKFSALPKFNFRRRLPAPVSATQS